MKRISLNGEYKLYNGNTFVCEAKIPGSDFGNMVKKRIIANPLNCSSEKEFKNIVEPVYNADHVFEKDFVLDENDLSADYIELSCDKVDTIYRCYINGKFVCEGNNVHIPLSCEVKKYLIVGKNTIKFEIDSAVTYIEQANKKDKVPRNANGIDGAAHLRKAACHFGWDWGPCIPYKYIGNVELLCYNKKIVINKIRQNFSDDSVEIIIDAENYDTITLVPPKGRKRKFKGNSIVINNPELWYSRDLLNGKNPSLYTVILENEEEKVEKKIGLRKIELNREKDQFGENFQFVLNGKRVFGKGANLIPFSAIPDFADEKTVDYYLDLAVKSNMNMIRVWGGAEYSTEYLLSRCDELGIMIWQDFCFACLLYPLYNDEFKKNVLREVECNVKRMDMHPSLTLWCGNNEIEAMFNYMPKSMKIIQAYIDFHFNELPEFISDYTEVPYIPSSPLGKAPFERNTADEVGDTHMWNVWHGLKPLNYYGKRYTRFLSEFGLESLPSMKAISTFATQGEYSLDSEAFMTHQKCIGGNKKMLFYLQERFFVPDNFDYLPYMTGIVQAECVKYATEHFRRNKGRCNGSIYWQFNDVWNCSSWSSVDYEGVPKALLYKSKSFMAPVSISYNEGQFIVYNDTLEEINLPVSVYINNEEKKFDLTLAPDSISFFFEYKLKRNDYVKVKWLDNELDIDRINTLPEAHFTVRKADDYLYISADKYAKNVFIESDSVADENYFCLLPGEEKKISFNGKIGRYRVICENNIFCDKNKIKRAVDRFLYRLKAENIANYLYYDNN